MRVRTVLIWVVVAGVLAGLVVLTRGLKLNGSDEAAPVAWTIPLDPARVVSLVRTGEDGAESRVNRAPGSVGVWNLRWRGPGDDAETRTWGGDDARIRAVLRLLGTTPIIADLGVAEPITGATVRAVESDGRSVEVTFGARSVGGRTPVSVIVRSPDGLAEKRVDGQVGSGVADALVRGDWSAWRDHALFEPGLSGVVALTMEAGDRGVRLERGGTGWGITRPFVLEADTGEVQRVLGVIHSLQAASFEDSPPPDEVTGLDEPVATIRVERDGGARTLTIGRPADADGTELFARVRSGDVGGVVRVDAERIGDLTAVAEAYARRTPLGVSVADIGMVRLFGLEAQTLLEAARVAGEWSVGGRPASPDERDAIDRLLLVLTAEPAALSASRDLDSDSKGFLGRVEVLTGDGRPIGSFTLRVGEGLRLVMVRDRDDGVRLVWTNISEQAKAVAVWAGALANRGVEAGG